MATLNQKEAFEANLEQKLREEQKIQKLKNYNTISNPNQSTSYSSNTWNSGTWNGTNYNNWHRIDQYDHTKGGVLWGDMYQSVESEASMRLTAYCMDDTNPKLSILAITLQCPECEEDGWVHKDDYICFGCRDATME